VIVPQSTVILSGKKYRTLFFKMSTKKIEKGSSVSFTKFSPDHFTIPYFICSLLFNVDVFNKGFIYEDYIASNDG
jgi:hypothetical protein